MPEQGTIAVFLLAALPICATPGPGMLYVISRGSAQGPRAAVVSSIGLSIGTLIHTSLVAFGVAQLLRAVPLAYTTVRFLGAAYLMWIGYRMLTAPAGGDRHGGAQSAATSMRRLFVQGAITGTLNPKVALFLLAFLPQFVDPAEGSVAAKLLLLGVLFECLGSLFNIAAGVLAGSAAAVLQRPAVRERLDRTSGLVCMALGVKLAASETS